MAEQKTQAELKSINDKNLLAYYKAERQRVYHAIGYTSDNTFNNLTPKQQADRDYLKVVKRELETRGHVEDK